ncbi:DUF1467 family protein [Afifella sp. IM 167]|uniref:DUF1467 family protein n=1 Tax=Afifella sp. IM 167 TaxID=2033586 RepID=UPI001CCAC56B|nr:DUF1467 family protein [Afifella sp. IM 167]MBZ8132286.1 hypothetical protein [Afifella sp. IM 167]
MSWFAALAVYFVIWWLCLFAVLPWGIRTQEEEGDITLGTDRAAPAAHRMGRKLLVNSLVAAILFALIYAAINVFHISLEDLVV